LINRIKRRMSFILYWMLAGVFLSLTIIAVDVATSIVLIIVSTVLGVYFGLGMPICMGYYAAATEAGNRARLGGIIFLIIGLGFFLFSGVGITDVTLNALVLATWRAVGLVILIFLKPDEKQTKEKGHVSYSFVISNRSFLLYFIPWCMFSLVNYLAVPINTKFFPEDFVLSSSIIENILAGIFAVAFGFFADSRGRKRLAIAGFALLGFGYASLGLFPGNVLGWWFYTTVDGIAWGAFYTIFLVTIWGDLAQEQSSEKYYAIGSLPFLFSIFMRLSIGAYVAARIAEFAVFSFASVFLFLAVLPLIYAPETLPEKTIRERELKQYIDKAQKIREKYALD
jgi:MFS family permease